MTVQLLLESGGGEASSTHLSSPPTRLCRLLEIELIVRFEDEEALWSE